MLYSQKREMKQKALLIMMCFAASSTQEETKSTDASNSDFSSLENFFAVDGKKVYGIRKSMQAQKLPMHLIMHL